MNPLRIFCADAASGVDELFARVPCSAIEDRDLSPSALRLLAAIQLDMVRTRNHRFSMATNADLARSVGLKPRQITNLIRELEARGHIAVEPVRTIAGSPRGLRPLATLRPAKYAEGIRSNDHEGIHPKQPEGIRTPTQSIATPHATDCYAPSNPLLPPTQPIARLFKREERERKIPENGPAASAATMKGSPPPPARVEETEEGLRGLAAIAQQPGPVGRLAAANLRAIAEQPGPEPLRAMARRLVAGLLTEAHGKAPGSPAKDTPGPQAGSGDPSPVTHYSTETSTPP